MVAGLISRTFLYHQYLPQCQVSILGQQKIMIEIKDFFLKSSNVSNQSCLQFKIHNYNCQKKHRSRFKLASS